MIKRGFAVLCFLCLVGLASFEGLASGASEIPWPMPGYNAAGTGCSPYVGIDSPWLIPLLTEEEIIDQAGVGLELTDDFLLIGKDGILFLSATPYEKGGGGPGIILVAIDPTEAKVLWTTPIQGARFYDSSKPAIGPEGTVYVYDRKGNLIGLDPHTGDAVWQPDCQECLQNYMPEQSAAMMCASPPYPFSPDIIIGPQGYLYAFYRLFFVVFGPAPDRPVIEGVPHPATFAFMARPVIGPDGMLYFLSRGDSGGYAVKAVAPDGTERWNTFISEQPELSLAEHLHMVAGERSVYVLVAEEGGNPRVVALDRERGNILWTQELVGQCGTPFVEFSRPVLSPSGLLYVLLPRADGEWLVALDTQNGGEPSWSARVGDAVLPYEGRTNFSLLLTADDTLLVEAEHGLVQIDGQTGEISSCIVPVPYNVGSMAMASDGTVYAAGGGSHDVMMTVPNEPPRILSLKAFPESVNERTNSVRVRFEAEVEDPLGWNRSVILNWDYGDGNTRCDLPRRLREENGTYSTSFHSYHTYELTATAPVELTVSVEGCSQIFATSEALVCLEPPTIEPAEATPGNVYAGETGVTFTCRAVPPDCALSQALEYEWNFGDGDSGTGEAANHCYSTPGDYQATVTVNVVDSPIQTSSTVAVVVAGPPTLSISTTPNSEQPTGGGIRLDFNCQVDDPFEQTPSSFEWSFGDGEETSSMGDFVTHTYAQQNTYDASVTVQFPGGESFPNGFQVCAQPPEILALTAWPSPTYAGTPVDFSCSVPGCAGQAAPYSWNFGDGVTQSGDDLSTSSHQYDAAGTYTVEVTVGTSPLDVRETTVLTVFELPRQLTATANADPSSGIFPLTVNFRGVAAAPEGTSVTGYTWNFGDGASSNDQNPTHTYSTNGSYTATLTVTAGSDSDEASVFIRPQGFTHVEPGCLTIDADQAETQDDGATTYSGNVVLNDFLKVGGSLQQLDNGPLTGSGGLTIQNNDYPIPFPSSFAIGDEAQDQEDNCYRLITLAGMDNPPSDFTFNLYGFGLTLEWPRLYEDRLLLKGTINPYGDWAFDLGFSLSDDGIDLDTRVDIPDFSIAGLGFSDVYVEVNTYASTWGGGASLEIPNYFTVGVEVGFLGSSLDDIHISVEDSSVPIGTPPVIYLTGVSGGLDNIVSNDPLIISLGASLSAGPSISFAGEDYHLLAGDVDITIDLGGRFTATGTLFFLSESIGKIGSGEIVFDLNDGLYVSGTLYYPPVAPFITATGQGKVDFDLNFQARLDGELSTPSNWWLIGGMTFAQAAVYVDNDLISAGVALGRRVCCCWHCLDLTIDVSVTVDFDSGDVEVAKNWDHIQEVTFSTLHNETMAYGGIRPTGMARTGNVSRSTGPFIECAFGPRPVNQPYTVFADSSGGYGQDLQDHTFEIPEDLSVVIFRVLGDPSFTLTDPNRNVYDQTQASPPSSFTEPQESEQNNILVGLQESSEPAFILWRSNDVIDEAWCAVQRPCKGQWTVTCKPKAQVEALRPNQKPTLTMLEPREDLTVEAGDNVTIEWKAADEDSAATVRFCYTKSPSHDDHGKPVLPGSTITTGLQEEENKWKWDTDGIAPGRYYIYGVTTDDKNFPVFAWSAGSVTVQRSDFPPPENVTAKPDGSTVQVEWKAVPGAAGYSIYYQDVQETVPLVLATSQAVWEDTTTVLQHLEPGVTYRIAVTAFNEEGLESDYSEIIEVTVGGE